MTKMTKLTLAGRKSQRIAVAVALVAMPMVGGCSFSLGEVPAATPESNHPIRVVSENVVLPIDFAATSTGKIRREDLARLDKYLADYSRSGVGPLSIGVPVDIGSRRLVQTAVANVRAGVLDRGVNAIDIHMQPYRPARGTGPILLTYTRNRALPPACGKWEVVDASLSNAIAADYGCSLQHNLARMIIRPGELRRAAPLAVDYAGRATELVEAYATDAGSAKIIPGGVEVGGGGGGN